MQTIFIEDLEIYAFHGVYDEEKDKGQRFLINAEADILSGGHKSDELGDTVDYGKLCEFIEKYFVENRKNLLESLVSDLQKAILDEYKEIQTISLKIGKPDVDLPFELKNIGIQSTLARHRIYLGIGSNMGDKAGYIDMAIKELGDTKGITDIRVSDLIVTKPYGGVEQDDFLNGVIEAKTYLDPYELLDLCHRIEAKSDRVREVHWGPRTLDLDILFYDDLVLDDPDLCIPHADLHNRSFVLNPLCELNPYLLHPVFGKRVIDLKRGLEIWET